MRPSIRVEIQLRQSPDMVSGPKTFNRGVFLLFVMLTGMLAGAAIWAVLFVMDVGISALWSGFEDHIGGFYPLVVCLIGGVVIGLFTRRFGRYPENLPEVMAKVKENGRYEYDKLGVMSVGAVLPLVFGGSVGPEAGLTGVIAGLCTWVGDRMRSFGRELKGLTDIGMYAALSAVFTAPLFGLAGVSGKTDAPEMSRLMKLVTYAFAIIGAMLAMHLLGEYVGGGMSMPRYDGMGFGDGEALYLLPVCLVGALAGWLFRLSDNAFHRISDRFGDRDVVRSVIGGLVLGICGMVLPFTLFSGEAQTGELDSVWTSMTAMVLIGTGFVKIAATAFCVNMGWRGGHFFPVIFSGIAIGYGLSAALGVDPMFAVCATTAAVVGGVMRKPLMTVLLLFLCFPLHSVVILAISAVIGAYLPLPVPFGKKTESRSHVLVRKLRRDRATLGEIRETSKELVPAPVGYPGLHIHAGGVLASGTLRHEIGHLGLECVVVRIVHVEGVDAARPPLDTFRILQSQLGSFGVGVHEPSGS